MIWLAWIATWLSWPLYKIGIRRPLGKASAWYAKCLLKRDHGSWARYLDSNAKKDLESD